MAASPGSLVGFALLVLATPDAFAKAALTRRALAAWRTGALPAWLPCDGGATWNHARHASLVGLDARAFLGDCGGMFFVG